MHQNKSLEQACDSTQRNFAQGFYFLVMDCIVDPLGETTNLANYMAFESREMEEEKILHFFIF